MNSELLLMHDAWFRRVESETGGTFAPGGAGLVLVEEMGELMEAIAQDDLEEFRDAVGDVWWAAQTLRHVALRRVGGDPKYPPVGGRGGPKLIHTNIPAALAITQGRVVSVQRKGVEGREEVIARMCWDIMEWMVRLAAYAGQDFEACARGVAQELAGRRYKMGGAGSAEKV